VQVLKTWVRTPLNLRARNATNFIPTGIHPRKLNINWLSKVNVKPVSTELALLQKNVEYKSSTEAKLDEARVREEKLIKSNEEFKQEMKQQAEETQRMMKQMMEMFQKQA